MSFAHVFLLASLDTVKQIAYHDISVPYNTPELNICVWIRKTQ